MRGIARVYPVKKWAGAASCSTSKTLLSLLTLTSLEIVLGIDNIVVIAIIAATLPVHQREKARIVGLSLAMITRLLLLFSRNAQREGREHKQVHSNPQVSSQSSR